MINKKLLFFFLMIPFLGSAQVTLKQPTIESGVSKALADFRSTVIRDVQYQLNFDIPASKTEAISAKELLTFHLLENRFPVQLDFKAQPDQIKTITVNGKRLDIHHQTEHIIIPAAVLVKGKNIVQIEFVAGNSALNRNDDYLYTLFVPGRARTAFPCFDQPDLKATYQLSLTIPENWEAISNGKLQKRAVKQGRKTVDFASSDKICTYLFSFSAGRFATVSQAIQNQPVQFLYRETDSAKINLSTDSIFQEHRNALDFLSAWTNIPYPFQKIGFVAIPDYQFGGMEHPGAVQYQGSTLFLDATATKSQFISRTNLIAHEMAHMWFGDLVSIKWFNDVWTKEVFANFMADKVSESLKGKEAFDHKFLIDHFPAAYGIDRTRAANPIRQPLGNLNEAGSLYGNIIYHKAPIMMRQLELLMGKAPFQKGMREYLQQFSFSNASWPDLINILNKYAPIDLIAWNKVWVEDNGRPKISEQLEIKNGKIARLTISQKPEFGKARVWPQSFKISLFYKDRIQELPVSLSGKGVDVKAAIGLDKPDFIIYNSSGEGYGVWPIDLSVLTQTSQISSPLIRASFYIAAYENMLNQDFVTPASLLNYFRSQIQTETDELNLRLLTGYIGNIFWSFNNTQSRSNLAPGLETQIWQAIEKQSLSNNKKNLLKLYQTIFLTGDAYNNLYPIWKNQTAPEGVKFSEDDYTALALALKLRKNDLEILDEQLKRIKNPDRIKRFEFMMKALSADVTVRDQFFKSLADPTNREKESNVLAGLNYLHHPLQQPTSIQYLKKSLELLQEIQITGDIFFPQNWLQATLSDYQSAAALKIVQEFLNAHPDYPPKLRAKILQATDQLERTQRLLVP